MDSKIINKLGGKNASLTKLVGGWTNPFEKYACQNGNLPKDRDENKNILKTTT